MKQNLWLRKCTVGVLQAVMGMAVLLGPTRVLADPPSGNWKLTFSDDFNGTTLDTKKWDTCYWWAPTGCNNGGSGDMQWYQPDDVIVDNGVLHLRAQRRSMNGYNYTSGMITSHDKYSFQYGYAEMRAKLPKGKGFWPSFWFLPQSSAWPPELDAMEYLGHDPTRVHMSLHYKGSSGNPEATFSNWAGPDFSADFHTFAVQWDPNYIIWYVDGVERKRYEVSGDIPKEPMYVAASLALAAGWTNTPPDNTTPLPNSMDIDYIKVWQRN